MSRTSTRPPENEVEAAEQEVLDQATAARSIAELKAEIETLKALESLALEARRSGTDTKWRELASLLGEIFTVGGLVVARRGAGRAVRGRRDSATDSVPAAEAGRLHRASRHAELICTIESHHCSGRAESVVSIHGGVGREDRLKAQEAFRHDPQVQVLLATDAAGEGINLQRAHLMVNYDLPWNPNRLEQRFGRIHRIGQTEVCHLWNLVADETREGDVYRKLLDKLEQARKSLGGQVFDVLGKLHFEGRPLRELMVEGDPFTGSNRRFGRAWTPPSIRPSTAAGLQDLLEGACPRAGRHGLESRAARPRGHGAGRGTPASAALRRVVLPRSVSSAWAALPEATRGATLRGHPRSCTRFGIGTD